MPIKPPRKPGSQVAPNEKPIGTPSLTESTAGKLYRVRDRGWDKVWGEGLTYADAMQLKERLVAKKKSRTARVEPMDEVPPPWYVPEEHKDTSEVKAEEPSYITIERNNGVIERYTPTTTPLRMDGDGIVTVPAGYELVVNDVVTEVPALVGLGDRLHTVPQVRAMPKLAPEYVIAAPIATPGGVRYSIERAGEAVTAPGSGAVVSIPAGCQLFVNGSPASVPQSVAKDDELEVRILDPVLAHAQAKALAAARPFAAAAQARAPRVVPRDITATPLPPRNPNPPRDKTASKDPPFVRLSSAPAAAPRPPPSPLKVAEETDGTVIADDVITDEDLGDLIPDLGGLPTAGDLELAKRQRETEERSKR